MYVATSLPTSCYNELALSLGRVRGPSQVADGGRPLLASSVCALNYGFFLVCFVSDNTVSTPPAVLPPLK